MYLKAAVLVLSATFSMVACQRPAVTSWSTPQPPMLNLLESVKPCEYTTVVLTFLPYLVDIQNCTTDSNYSFVPPAAFPTAKQTQALCTKPTCTSALSTLQSLDMPNCTVDAPTGVPVLLDVLIRRIVASCQPPTTTLEPSFAPGTTMPTDELDAAEPWATPTSSAPRHGMTAIAPVLVLTMLMPLARH